MNIKVFGRFTPSKIRSDFCKVFSSETQIALLVRKIFESSYLTFEFSYALSSIALRKFCWFNPLKHLEESSWNIGKLSDYHLSISSIWNPLFAEKEIGIEQGLRVVSPIRYPSTGLCLGKSLAFLGERKTSAARVQGIYNCLLGTQGSIKNEERMFFRKILNQERVEGFQTAFPELLETVQRGEGRVDRKFVFADLEKKKVPITPNLYSLVLELDGKYDEVHTAIIDATARTVGLKVRKFIHLQGKVEKINSEINTFPEGNYLIQFFNHSIALKIKSNQFFLLDPNHGKSSHPEDLLNLLTYYAFYDHVSVRILTLDSSLST